MAMERRQMKGNHSLSFTWFLVLSSICLAFLLGAYLASLTTHQDAEALGFGQYDADGIWHWSEPPSVGIISQ